MRIAKIEREVKHLFGGGEIKATNDDQGIVEGYLNYIGNIDFGDDRTMAGAFQKTLKDSYARKSRQKLDFLWPYLFNHDYNQLPPGGIFEANEDLKGLYVKVQFNLDMQMGRELYASFKMGTMKKQSMGYRAIQSEWVKDEVTNRPIRNLLEVAVMEGSAVVFPMNDLAQVDTVKRFWPGYSAKGSASGKTTWPLAERGVSWDKGSAMKDIQAYAASGDTVDWSKAAQCFFWVAKSPPENWGDCKFPFTAKSGGSMKAIPAAIFNGAARLDNANIDDKDGVRAKMAVYYRKMKAPIPWEKGAIMNIHSKDYAESYMMTNQQDWIADLWDLWYPLRNEILTAFKVGDTIEEDVQQALAQFAPAVLAYVQRGIELNMTDCMQPDDGDSGGGSMPMMMSAADNPETKDVKLLSAASHAKMLKAVGGMEGHLKEMKSELSRQRANALQGYTVYGADDPIPEHKEEEQEEEEVDETARINKIRAAVYDLTTRLQFQNADMGI